MLNNDPILVNCIFDQDKVITEISHFQEKPLVVDHCNEVKCWKQEIDYGVPLAQLEALISLSETCSQSITYDCFLAPLESEEQFLGGWIDHAGIINFYLDPVR